MLFKCASPECPGLPYKASEQRHPCTPAPAHPGAYEYDTMGQRQHACCGAHATGEHASDCGDKAPAHPGPWRYERRRETPGMELYDIFDENGDFVTCLKGCARAARIVEAVNATGLVDSYRDTLAAVTKQRDTAKADLAVCVARIQAMLEEGGRLAVQCCHLDGDGTWDEVRCWNEVTADARALLGRLGRG